MTRSDRRVLKDSAAYMEDQARRIRAREVISAAARKHLRKMDYLAARLRALVDKLAEHHRGDLSVIVCTTIGIVVLSFTGW